MMMRHYVLPGFVAMLACIVPAFSGTEATEDGASCACSTRDSVYYTLKTDEKGVVLLSEKGEVQIVKADQPMPKMAVTAKTLTGTRVTACAECETGEQGTGGRRGCDSSWSVFTVPDGYVFSKDTRQDSWEIETGSENDVNVVWEDYVDVIPGLQAPRTMKVSVHARSNGIGTQGHSKCCVSAVYVKIP